MTFMSCNVAFYSALGLKGHRNCAENIAEAMKPFGMRDYLEATSVDPFNVFQNTPDMALKDIGCSRPGDYVEFEVLKDAIVGVSSCPYDVVSMASLAINLLPSSSPFAFCFIQSECKNKYSAHGIGS